MKRSRNMVLALLLLLSGKVLAYRDVPALIYLNANEQKDTLGFNLVKSLCSHVYPLVLSGKIPLYDGPGKKLTIGPSTLTSLEQSSGTRFEDCPDLFIYEYWSSSKRSTEFRVIGLSFINKNSQGEKVSFGYVDIQELMPFVIHSFVPNNANGTHHLTFEQAIMSRRYQYHLVQMGQETFANEPLRALELRNEAFFSGKNIITQYPFPQEKLVVYQIMTKKYPTDIDLGNQVIAALRQVLQQNPEVFLNYGGDQLDSFPDTLFFVPEIRGVLIEEIWQKKERELLLKNARIKIFFADEELEWISLKELEELGILIGFKNLGEVLRNKPFQFELYRINDQEVDPEEGEKYFQALKKSPWARISEYVQ